MKKFNVTVNGVSYEVLVEEMDGNAVSAPIATPVVAPAPQTVSAPAPKATPAPAPKATPAPATTGAVSVNAPMPGTILDVKVSVGQAVKSGDLLCILEAMKMENEILAPQDGTVASVQTSKGSSVSAGDLLLTLN